MYFNIISGENMQNYAEKTINSVKKMNDFPFYTAEYFGDYKIKEFESGAVKSPSDIVPFFEDMFKKLGAPVTLAGRLPGNIWNGCSAFFCRIKSNKALVGKNLN
jgi:hypothetical protein